MVTYTLTESWTGDDTFTFRCRDAVGAVSSTATGTVTVAKARIVLILHPGTNAVSIPIIPDAGWAATGLFADPDAGGTFYKQDVRVYDADNNLFASTDDLELGRAVFLTLRDDITEDIQVQIEGTPVAGQHRFTLFRGWNFVGGSGQGTEGTATADPNGAAVLAEGTLRTWDGTGWAEETDGTLNRGSGHLLYLFRGGDVDLPLDTAP